MHFHYPWNCTTVITPYENNFKKHRLCHLAIRKRHILQNHDGNNCLQATWHTQRVTWSRGPGSHGGRNFYLNIARRFFFKSLQHQIENRKEIQLSVKTFKQKWRKGGFEKPRQILLKIMDNPQNGGNGWRKENLSKHGDGSMTASAVVAPEISLPKFRTSIINIT